MFGRLVDRFAPPRDQWAFGFTTLAVFAGLVVAAVLRLAQTAPLDP